MTTVLSQPIINEGEARQLRNLRAERGSVRICILLATVASPLRWEVEALRATSPRCSRRCLWPAARRPKKPAAGLPFLAAKRACQADRFRSQIDHFDDYTTVNCLALIMRRASWSKTLFGNVLTSRRSRGHRIATTRIAFLTTIRPHSCLTTTPHLVKTCSNLRKRPRSLRWR
jgi:hypothetical protein